MAAIDIQCELKLKRGEERRLQAGHQWVFSNELEKVDTAVPAGTLCRVVSESGKLAGTGFFNPHSLIAVRLLSRGEEPLDASFVESRVYAALRYRQRLGLDRYARIVYSEGDFLPGLMLDRYGDLVVAEVLTAGMELLKPQVVDAINKIIQPRGILFRNDNAYRKLEGLPGEVEKIGEVPAESLAAEGSLKYMFSTEGGQKTGFFYDQRDNRLFLEPYFKDRRVLDLYCYVGGFAMRAAASGAEAVWGIDSSAAAIDFATRNAELNGLKDKVSFQREDAERALAALKNGSLPADPDFIVLDPPNFVKSRKNMVPAMRLYSRLNETALRGLPRGGMLATATCSHHVQREDFVDMLKSAAAHSGRNVALVELRGQAKDHPVLINMPETEYLHFALLEVR